MPAAMTTPLRRPKSPPERICAWDPCAMTGRPISVSPLTGGTNRRVTPALRSVGFPGGYRFAVVSGAPGGGWLGGEGHRAIDDVDLQAEERVVPADSHRDVRRRQGRVVVGVPQ